VPDEGRGKADCEENGECGEQLFGHMGLVSGLPKRMR
jgi:hypothetical protein